MPLFSTKYVRIWRTNLFTLYFIWATEKNSDLSRMTYVLACFIGCLERSVRDRVLGCVFLRHLGCLSSPPLLFDCRIGASWGGPGSQVSLINNLLHSIYTWSKKPRCRQIVASALMEALSAQSANFQEDSRSSNLRVGSPAALSVLQIVCPAVLPTSWFPLSSSLLKHY